MLSPSAGFTTQRFLCRNRKFRWLAFVMTGCLLLSACYHMRVEAESIAPRIITVPSSPIDPLKKVLLLVEGRWRNRILEADTERTSLITVPYHFATDTGPGQPAGGRKYYMQLKIDLRRQEEQTIITVSPHNYEIRTSYAYNLDSQIQTLYKHYPYEQYPGMFDLAPLHQELERVESEIKKLFGE
ncbi:MAG TPA: hypothetical protein HPP76_08550 [Desulfuromonadales bacterium]|nr:hypothetical protein [Desulfuromonadales bacterium]